MIMESLHISRGYNGKQPLHGTIEFKGGTGKITLNLREELAIRVLAICADELVEASKLAAAEMTAEIITALPAPAAIEGGKAKP